MKAFALTAALAVVAFASAATAEPVTFQFETGQRTGVIMLAIYDSAQTYGGGRPVVAEALPVTAGVSEITLDLPVGDYGMKAFHDVDGDGRMNTNPFGMPTEPYAFSNNAVGNMGPASWDRARFSVSGATTQTITIR